MITRRSFLWQMFGAGIWAVLARWFKKEPTKRVVAYDWGKFTELTPHGGIYIYKDDDGVERVWGPINVCDRRVNYTACLGCYWWFTCDWHRNADGECVPPWETFLMAREDLESLARETFKHSRVDVERLADTEGKVNYRVTTEPGRLDWSIQPKEEDVRRIRKLLAKTGCKVDFRINYSCRDDHNARDA